MAQAMGQLTYHRAVDRKLLHRSTDTDIFVTDGRAVPNGYVVAARLPLTHPYYWDHLTGPPAIDPMLLLECCRQAETYGGHVFQGIGFDRKFILRSWSMRLFGIPMLPEGGQPARLSLIVAVRGRRTDGRPPSALTYDTTITIGGHPIGRVTIEVGYLSAAAYRYLRNTRRAPVLSTEVTATPATIAPELTGRHNPANVLLRDVLADNGCARATIRRPVDNRTMFEHPHDHLPGMVLTEAARQLCVLADHTLDADSPARTTVTAFDLSFARYAELDTPTSVEVRPGQRRTGGSHTYAVAFQQSGDVIADGWISTAAVPEPAEDAG